jgi:hypothetical protein
MLESWFLIEAAGLTGVGTAMALRPVKKSHVALHQAKTLGVPYKK